MDLTDYHKKAGLEFSINKTYLMIEDSPNRTSPEKYYKYHNRFHEVLPPEEEYH
jgi:hypothetical protein